MKIFKHSRWDSLMLALSVAQFVVTLLFAIYWAQISALGRAAGFALLVFMTVYNIIVVSHLFTHAAWFHWPLLNRFVSMLNSVNIGQSVQTYQLTHVRNHHRYNNDQPGVDGQTKDSSSTYRGGVDGEHVGVVRYAVVGAVESLVGISRALFSLTGLWRVSNHEVEMLSLFLKSPAKRRWELRQVQLDRMAQFFAVGVFLAISWQWFLVCYLPAFFVALALVNVQNYYEHYGANPESRYANSVSYYGTLYNLVTFNDGYHQEHHLRPLAHWKQMPRVNVDYGDKLNHAERIVSPVPAILGILHRNRKLLHRRRTVVAATISSASNTLSKAAAGK
jgi:fatty acid desaturase